MISVAKKKIKIATRGGVGKEDEYSGAKTRAVGIEVKKKTVYTW